MCGVGAAAAAIEWRVLRLFLCWPVFILRRRVSLFLRRVKRAKERLCVARWWCCCVRGGAMWRALSAARCVAPRPCTAVARCAAPRPVETAASCRVRAPARHLSGRRDHRTGLEAVATRAHARTHARMHTHTCKRAPTHAHTRACTHTCKTRARMYTCMQRIVTHCLRLLALRCASVAVCAYDRGR